MTDPQPSPTSATPGRLQATVLLAEDDMFVRASVEIILRGVGYQVVAAHDGASALRHADDYGDRIDLVVTDISMPGMDGDELVRRLRSQRPELAVVFMSATPRDDLIAGSRVHPDDLTIQKPFKPDALVRLAGHALDTGRGPGSVQTSVG